MSQQGLASAQTGGGGTTIETLTGNSGGAVGPDAFFNINVVGNNASGINVVGNPGANTLTIVGIQATTSQRGTVTLATNAETIAGTDTSKVTTPDDIKAKLGVQTNHGLPIGAGTAAAFTWTSDPTNGQLLIGSTGVDPVLGNLTSSGGTITITNGPGTINLDLAGGGIAFDQIHVDAHTAPGTDPVVPTAAGQLNLTGAQVAAGTIGANVVRTDSLAANTITIEIQRSTSNATTDSTKNGVSHFNSTYFTVDSNGFVDLNGSGVGETITGDSGGALSPTAGNWNILGGTGISTSGTASTLTISATGTTVLTYKSVNHAASPYTVLTSDDYLGVNTSGGVVTILLPNAPVTGRVFIIKDSNGTSATSAITVTTVGGVVNIDGATSYTMGVNYQSIQVIFNGASYEVF